MVTRLPGTFGKASDETGTEIPIGRAASAGVTMEFQLASEQRVCGPGDVVVIPGGAEHEAWRRHGGDRLLRTRDDFLLGGKPAYMSEG
jgi:hypothetical protein